SVTQVRMHRLDARDVEPASGRRRDERDRFPGELPREHDLLQVAARQLPGRNIRARRADVVALDDALGQLTDASHAQHRAERHLRLAVRLQHDVRGNAQTRRDAGAEAVFGNVGDTGTDRGARIAVANTSPPDAHLPGSRRTHPDDRLRKLALTVARDASDAHDLPGTHGQRHVSKRSHAAVAVSPHFFELEHGLTGLAYTFL